MTTRCKVRWITVFKCVLNFNNSSQSRWHFLWAPELPGVDSCEICVELRSLHYTFKKIFLRDMVFSMEKPLWYTYCYKIHQPFMQLSQNAGNFWSTTSLPKTTAKIFKTWRSCCWCFSRGWRRDEFFACFSSLSFLFSCIDSLGWTTNQSDFSSLMSSAAASTRSIGWKAANKGVPLPNVQDTQQKLGPQMLDNSWTMTSGWRPAWCVRVLIVFTYSHAGWWEKCLRC